MGLDFEITGDDVRPLVKRIMWMSDYRKRSVSFTPRGISILCKSRCDQKYMVYNLVMLLISASANSCGTGPLIRVWGNVIWVAAYIIGFRFFLICNMKSDEICRFKGVGIVYWLSLVVTLVFAGSSIYLSSMLRNAENLELLPAIAALCAALLGNLIVIILFFIAEIRMFGKKTEEDLLMLRNGNAKIRLFKGKKEIASYKNKKYFILVNDGRAGVFDDCLFEEEEEPEYSFEKGRETKRITKIIVENYVYTKEGLKEA